MSRAIGGDPEASSQAVADLLNVHPPTERLLLVIDRFEELFTQADRAEQSRIITAVQALGTVEACVLHIAKRADFYPHLMYGDLWPVDPMVRDCLTPWRGLAR